MIILDLNSLHEIKSPILIYGWFHTKCLYIGKTAHGANRIRAHIPIMSRRLGGSLSLRDCNIYIWYSIMNDLPLLEHKLIRWYKPLYNRDDNIIAKV